MSNNNKDRDLLAEVQALVKRVKLKQQAPAAKKPVSAIATPANVRFGPTQATKPKPAPVRKPAAPTAIPKPQNAKIKKINFTKNASVMVMNVLGADSKMYEIHVDSKNIFDSKAFGTGSIIKMDFKQGKPVYLATVKRNMTVLGVKKPDRFQEVAKFAKAVQAFNKKPKA